MRVHFYKAKSRLGIINPPFGQKDLNFGVEDAPDAILTKEFLKQFDSVVSEFTFSLPEHINKSKYLDLFAHEASSFKDLINRTLKPQEMQVVIGGDNSVTFSSLLALLERVRDPNKLGYIQFDSHGEMNLYATSPTKNFHGMYLRPFLDSFDIHKIKGLISKKLILKNILFIGDLNLDKEEKVFFNKMGFKNIDRSDVLGRLDLVLKELKEFVSRFDDLHVNFDVDVFNSKEVMATGIPSHKGFVFKDLLPIIKVVSTYKNFSLDLCEVNPKKTGVKETIDIAQKVIAEFLFG